jgi:DNA-binding transcriptional ArsR family regulator
MDKHKIFKGLGNKRRLMIVEFLLKKDKGASLDTISRRINLSYRSTSKHLLLLESIGILDKANRGRNVYYSVKKNIKPIIKKFLLLGKQLS